MFPDPGRTGFAAAIAVSALLGALYILNQVPGLLEKPTIFVALLFFPLLVFVLLSGSISEISGPNGWGAKFRALSEQRVDLDAEVLPIQLVAKESQTRLMMQVREIDPNSALAVGLKVHPDADEKKGNHDPDILAQYLKDLLKIDPELTVIYVDPSGKFLASSDGLSVSQLEDSDSFLSRYVQYINQYNPTEIRKIVPLTIKVLSAEQSNAEALRAMNKDRVRSIVVVDEFKKPVGVVRRDFVISRLLETLVE